MLDDVFNGKTQIRIFAQPPAPPTPTPQWTQGLSGQPSIQSLEDQYGVSWRQSPKEKTFFSRRKVIIDCIRTAISRGEFSASAVVRLETLCANGGWSLSQLYKRLNKKELIFP
ncbi:hypothetical protein K402DRAFT_393038 [Aulographum hederae CBS 113979]|uniref:Transcription activator GCR1-like domain-containing protein n=1 Tax=Aulographum hederae CBS 113979 TaxID=1176131 RepID=A0A6G1H285_9PEZI|nr:hypothetical protein K402DRAFT_393038 [Aulographum hederae CBS 113979]